MMHGGTAYYYLTGKSKKKTRMSPLYVLAGLAGIVAAFLIIAII